MFFFDLVSSLVVGCGFRFGVRFLSLVLGEIIV